MTVEKEVARLSAIIETSLGPNGSFTETMRRLDDRVEKIDERQQKHNVRIDRLEQSGRRRSWWMKTVATAWLGLAVAWLWDRLSHR